MHISSLNLHNHLSGWVYYHLYFSDENSYRGWSPRDYQDTDDGVGIWTQAVCLEPMVWTTTPNHLYRRGWELQSALKNEDTVLWMWVQIPYFDHSPLNELQFLFLIWLQNYRKKNSTSPNILYSILLLVCPKFELAIESATHTKFMNNENSQVFYLCC